MTREQFISQVESIRSAFRRFLAALCCGRTELADDIAQESFVKAYLSIDTLSSPDKFESWVFRIGYNTFLSHKRSERPYATYSEAINTPAADRADAAFQYEDLYAALNSLSDRERTALLLFYLEDYSIKDISEIIETSDDAVKQLLSRGRRHLRSLLVSPTPPNPLSH